MEEDDLLRELWNSSLFRWGALVAWIGLIFYLSAQPSLPNLTPGLPHLEEIGGHLVVYAVLALLWERALRGAGVRRPARWALCVVLLYGISDEYHQSFVPNRVMSLVDLAIDLIGAGVALLALGRLRAQRLAVARSS
jgi:VanZ family protein